MFIASRLVKERIVASTITSTGLPEIKKMVSESVFQNAISQHIRCWVDPSGYKLVLAENYKDKNLTLNEEISRGKRKLKETEEEVTDLNEKLKLIQEQN